MKEDKVEYYYQDKEDDEDEKEDSLLVSKEQLRVISKLILAHFKKVVTNRPTDGPTNGRTDGRTGPFFRDA